MRPTIIKFLLINGMKISVLLLFFSLKSFSQTAFGYKIPKTISSEMLIGNWKLIGSKDIKFYDNLKSEGKNYILIWNKIPAAYYLQSTWSFNADGTGGIIIAPSSPYKATDKIKFQYKLIFTPGNISALSYIKIEFEDGYTDKLFAFDYNGKNKLMLSYRQDAKGTTPTGYLWEDKDFSISFELKKI